MTSKKRNPARDDPLDGGQSTFLQGMQRSALGALLMTLTFATPAITLGIFLRDGVSGLMGVAALLTLVVGLLVLPKNYTASTTILAQESDIIQPLLEGRADPAWARFLAKARITPATASCCSHSRSRASSSWPLIPITSISAAPVRSSANTGARRAPGCSSGVPR